MRRIVSGFRLGLTTLAIGAIARHAEAATQFTGDVIDNVKVISELDVSDLEAGKSAGSCSRASKWRPAGIGTCR